MNSNSFLAANSFPIKIIANPTIISNTIHHQIHPVHVQLNPTNNCPLECSFCNCKNRDKKQYLSFEQITRLLNHFTILGARCVTITGGGEPLAHPDINKIICYSRILMDVGLATNGMLLNHLSPSTVDALSWCRISISVESPLKLESIEHIVEKHDIDWAFNYVVTDCIDYNHIKKCVDFAAKHKFTHVKMVDNIVSNSPSKLLAIKQQIQSPIIAYQNMKSAALGNKRCLLSLLRPCVGPDGFIYPCCGVQYADENPALNFPEKTRMGSIETIQEIWDKQGYFDGSKCDKCYYGAYNDVLNQLWNFESNIEHKKFI